MREQFSKQQDVDVPPACYCQHSPVLVVRPESSRPIKLAIWFLLNDTSLLVSFPDHNLGPWSTYERDAVHLSPASLGHRMVDIHSVHREYRSVVTCFSVQYSTFGDVCFALNSIQCVVKCNQCLELLLVVKRFVITDVWLYTSLDKATKQPHYTPSDVHGSTRTTRNPTRDTHMQTFCFAVWQTHSVLWNMPNVLTRLCEEWIESEALRYTNQKLLYSTYSTTLHM